MTTWNRDSKESYSASKNRLHESEHWGNLRGRCQILIWWTHHRTEYSEISKWSQSLLPQSVFYFFSVGREKKYKYAVLLHVLYCAAIQFFPYFAFEAFPRFFALKDAKVSASANFVSRPISIFKTHTHDENRLNIHNATLRPSQHHLKSIHPRLFLPSHRHRPRRQPAHWTAQQHPPTPTILRQRRRRMRDVLLGREFANSTRQLRADLRGQLFPVF